MDANKGVQPVSSYIRRLSWYLLIGISLYWVSNAMVVFPWIISKLLGFIAMFLSTILWGYMAYYCFSHVPVRERNRDTLSMATSFLVTGVVQDYLLYAWYRGIPDELYEPTTFVAYGLTFFLPFFVRYVIIGKRIPGTIRLVTGTKLMITAITGIAAFLLTIWSMRYW
jgi:hypothetical protein